ncbi:nucleotidyltransferase domain-containing protein [Candidatus Pacearchaeota archaeon]|nr:nucleotidyltransferase domain-containing protein [Candidatus Pacearchaeota archaeon]
MVKTLKYNDLNFVLTKREIETINKRLLGKPLNQQDSNYLSRFVRPRLRQILKINTEHILNQIEYNHKSHAIEKKIKKILMEELKEIKAIILFGSVVQTNYSNYRDIDCITMLEKPFWNKLHEKYKKINSIKKIFEKHEINIDLQIYDKQTFNDSKNSNISLMYQLHDSKIIYGKVEIPKKYEIRKMDLRMKLNYSIFEDSEYNHIKGQEIYEDIRGIILIRLLINKIIDNQKLNQETYDEISKNLAVKLRNNEENSVEKRIAILHLKRLIKETYDRLNQIKWEKIELYNH